MTEAYRTIVGQAIAEVVEKKSRFIAQLSHAETEEEALAFLDAVRTEHAQARHNVYAYTIGGHAGTAARVRYSDDGEPSGTSGMPTLNVLQHEELTDIICVTTRYFGGTLLGTGGLVRAYSAAAQKAIDAARIVTVSRCVDISLVVPYALYEQITRVAEAAGAQIVQSDFAEEVSLILRMLEGTQESLVDKIQELTRGQHMLTVSDPVEAVFAS